MQVEVKLRPGIAKVGKHIDDLYVKIMTSKKPIEFTANGRKIKKYKTLVLTYQNAEIIEIIGYEEKMNTNQITEQFSLIKQNVKNRKQETYPLYREERTKNKTASKGAFSGVRAFLQRCSKGLFGSRT